MGYYKKLKGDRLYLSPMNEDDYLKYTKWMNNLSTQIPLGNAFNTYNETSEKEAVERLARSGHNYEIVLNDGDEAIGNCSLFDINQVHRTAELGIFIGEDENRGLGYGTEAIKVLLSYGFKVLNLHNIMLKLFSFNERGIKAYEKVGFDVFGRRRDAYIINGRSWDEVYMEVLADEFECGYLDGELPG